MRERRDKLNERLKGHNQEKLKRKLPADFQILNVAQEMQMKKQLLEKMENMDKEYSKQMENLASNVKK